MKTWRHLPMKWKITIKFRGWISGTRQFFCESRSKCLMITSFVKKTFDFKTFRNSFATHPKTTKLPVMFYDDLKKLLEMNQLCKGNHAEPQEFYDYSILSIRMSILRFLFPSLLWLSIFENSRFLCRGISSIIRCLLFSIDWKSEEYKTFSLQRQTLIE